MKNTILITGLSLSALACSSAPKVVTPKCDLERPHRVTLAVGGPFCCAVIDQGVAMNCHNGAGLDPDFVIFGAESTLIKLDRAAIQRQRLQELDKSINSGDDT